MGKLYAASDPRQHHRPLLLLYQRFLLHNGENLLRRGQGGLKGGSGMRIIQIFGRESRKFEEFHEKNHSLYRAF